MNYDGKKAKFPPDYPVALQNNAQEADSHGLLEQKEASLFVQCHLLHVCVESLRFAGPNELHLSDVSWVSYRTANL